MGQQTQSGAILVSYADDVSYAVLCSTLEWIILELLRGRDLCAPRMVLRFLAALFGSKVSTSRKRATISTMALGALPRSLSSSRLFHSSTVAIR